MYLFFFLFFFKYFDCVFFLLVMIMIFLFQTGLHLLTTANTGSDESMIDEGMSSISENKRSKSEVR